MKSILILFVVLLLGAGYACYRYPAFRKAMGKVWADLLLQLSGEARRRKSRAANAQPAAQQKAPAASPAGNAPDVRQKESHTGISAHASGKMLDLMAELEHKLAEQQQQIADLQQRLSTCERQLRQLTTVRPADRQSASHSSATTVQPKTSANPKDSNLAPQLHAKEAPLATGRTYYAVRPTSELPYGFRNEDWGLTRPSHAVYAMTVKAGGVAAEFTIDAQGLKEVLNALAFYKGTISYVPVDPNPQTYVPIAGRLRYEGGVWQVAAPIRLEGRA